MEANAEDGIAQRRGIDGTGGSRTMQWMRSRDPAGVKFGNLGSIQQAIRSFCRSETTMRPENRHNASFRGGCIRTRHRVSDGFYRKDAQRGKGGTPRKQEPEAEAKEFLDRSMSSYRSFTCASGSNVCTYGRILRMFMSCECRPQDRKSVV